MSSCLFGFRLKVDAGGPTWTLLPFIIWLWVFAAGGAELRVDRIEINAEARPELRFTAEPQFYYVLREGEELGRIRSAVDLSNPGGGMGRLTGRPIASGHAGRFFRIEALPISAPSDLDGDGIDDVQELFRRPLLDPLNPNDANWDSDGDGVPNREELLRGTNPAVDDRFLFTTILSSPANGETGVSVTRETILRLSRPLAPGTVLTSDQVHAVAAGRRILSRIELSADMRAVTLFYLENLPGASKVQVEFRTEGVTDAEGQPLDGNGDGLAGGDGVIEFETLGITPLANTTVCGRVFASELARQGFGLTNGINLPLAGVIITADGLEERVRAVTDSNGNFRLTNAPAGQFFVHIDGRNITNAAGTIRYPDQAYYPYVGKRWAALPGTETNIGEVYLPLIQPDTLQPVSATSETIIEFPAKVVADHPELKGVSLAVPANALFGENGARGGRVGIAPVPPDRLPGRLPEGLRFPLVITVQTDGPSNFDQPVPACFPNLPDPNTGKVLPPGAKSALWSFNHDTGEFEVVGPMIVSADGRFVCTAPGVGILAPGWHGVNPGTPTGGGPPGDGDPSHPGVGCVLCFEPPMPEGTRLVDRSPTVDLNLATGEFMHTVVDLRVKGVGIDFEWRRTYRSICGTNTVQGNRWDFSYNIQANEDGEGVRVFNGTARDDLYMPPDFGARDTNIWVYNGFFREVFKDGNRLVQHHEDGSRWYFNPPENPAHGKVDRIEDRYGNAIRFKYDGDARLTSILDTLNREFRVEYNPDGFIASVKDFVGREIRYEYYDGTTTNGVRGDLKYVTGPRVRNTSTGNDFSTGKTTTYTYIAAPEGSSLAHKLTSISDYRVEENTASLPDTAVPRGPYLINAYTPNGKVTQQILGGGSLAPPGGVVGPRPPETNIIDITYRAIIPSDLSNPTNQIRFVATLNDRMGNVQEHYYDCAAQLRELREYTGRAAPTRPTTDTENRPGNPLRAGDPTYFETRIEYNDDFQPTQVIYPNTNIVAYYYEASRTVGVSQRLRGNVIRILRRNTPFNWLNPFAGPIREIEEKYEYLPGFGNPGAFRRPRFVTKATDGRGNVTRSIYDNLGNLRRRIYAEPGVEEEFEYNSAGQRIQHLHPAGSDGHRRRDTFRWDGGNLVEEIVDADGHRIATAYGYNPVGVLIRRIDPRGNDTLFEVNALDQVVLESSRSLATNPVVRYTKEFWYDEYNDLVRTRVRNFNGVELVASEPFVSTHFEYDLLHNLTRQRQQVSKDREVVTENVYDANRNVAIVRSGEAVAGRQLENVVQNVYDERNLLFLQRRAPGHAGQSTTQFDYDGNRNRTKVLRGLESQPQVEAFEYDAFDRKTADIRPTGAVVRHAFDENGNETNTVVFGALLDTEGAANNSRLSEISRRFDALNRVTRTANAHFTNGPPGGSVGDGLAISEVDFAPNSKVLRTRDDHGNETATVYDTADRVKSITDAKGNQTVFEYDPNGNPILITEVDRSDLGRPPERFVTRKDYDPLDRLIATTDSAGSVTRYGYDSRNNQTLVTDGRGNRTLRSYDGLNRLVETTRLLTANGIGSGVVVGSAITKQAWDDSSRLVAQTDANGHSTGYRYDPLNRRVETEYADGTVYRTAYDVFDNPVRTEDANGSIATSRFDALNRLVEKRFAPGPGVAHDTTFELYAYDGLSRLVRAEDDDSVVERTYDSLSNVTGESVSGISRLPSATVWSGHSEYRYDGVGNRLSVLYPGGRRADYDYDSLNRIKLVSEGDRPQVRYSYVGVGRIERREFANQTRTDWEYDGVQGRPNPVGDFGVRRPVAVTHTYTNTISTGGTPIVLETNIDRRIFTWDASGNKTSRLVQAVHIAEHRYGYDSLDRLFSSASNDSAGGTVTNGYLLDKLGNRLSQTNDGVGLTYVLSSDSPDPQDAQVNQYTGTPFDLRTSDLNGNLVGRTNLTGSVRVYAYDVRNQLVSSVDSVTGASFQYAYDPLGRRIQSVANGVTNRFFYAGFQTVEEQDGSGTTTATWLHGGQIDELLTMRRGSDEYFYHADDLQNVHAITVSSGRVVERYEYDDFGSPTVTTGEGVNRSASAVHNPYLFQSHRFDSESGFYYCRNRYMDPGVGRFIQRDPMGYVDGMNLFAFVGNNPWSRVDPFGTDSEDLVEAAEEIGSQAVQGAKDFVGDVYSVGERIGEALFELPENAAYTAKAFVEDPVWSVSETAKLPGNFVEGVADGIADQVVNTGVAAGSGDFRGTVRGLLNLSSVLLGRGASPTASGVRTHLTRLSQSERGAIGEFKSVGERAAVSDAAKTVQVTEAGVREVMQGAQLTSQQAGGISLPRVQKYVDRLRAGEVAPPIKVDGKMIVDGNHRYVAGRIVGQEPAVQPWLGGRPDRGVPWDKIKIDPEPWK